MSEDAKTQQAAVAPRSGRETRQSRPRRHTACRLTLLFCNSLAFRLPRAGVSAGAVVAGVLASVLMCLLLAGARSVRGAKELMWSVVRDTHGRPFVHDILRLNRAACATYSPVCTAARVRWQRIHVSVVSHVCFPCQRFLCRSMAVRMLHSLPSVATEDRVRRDRRRLRRDSHLACSGRQDSPRPQECPQSLDRGRCRSRRGTFRNSRL